MHVMIAVSSLSPEPAKSEAQERAQAALAGRDFVVVFQGVFVVAITQEAERAQLNQLLGAQLSEADPQSVFLISPAMSATSGTYLGRLVPAVWPEVNRRIAAA
jgi:hypothetical protein